MERLPEVVIAFVTLLLLPLLGVIGLMQKRAIPVLTWTLVLWGIFGVWALASGHTFDWSDRRFLRGWLVGLGLGLAFLLVAWLRNQPRVSPWIKLGLGLATVYVFVRALYLFVDRYA